MKLFCVSDVHGNYDAMKKALDEAGFDPSNEDHLFIGCGDFFDRFHQPLEVMDYVMSLPRKVLIKGNHESLLMDCLQRGFPCDHDWGNGTAHTIIDLAPYAQTFDAACVVAYEKVKPFIYSMVNYFETKNYIFVHSFVPLNGKDDLPVYYTRNRKFEIDPDWRYAHHNAWETAMWGNPYELAEKGFLPDKTLVFGHFHTSWPRHKYYGKPEFGDGADFSIYYGNGYIALDACTAYSGKVNVLVIEDEFIKDVDKHES